MALPPSRPPLLWPPVLLPRRLSEYYAARRQHQEQQQRLNQVGAAEPACNCVCVASCVAVEQNKQLWGVGAALDMLACTSGSVLPGRLPGGPQLAKPALDSLQSPTDNRRLFVPVLQVLYGYPGHDHMASYSHFQHTAQHPPQQAQLVQAHPQAPAPGEQGTSSMMDCVASPRQPLASVCNHYGGHGGSGMQWEGAASLAGRKRGHWEASALGGEQAPSHPGGPGPGTGVGRRS